MVHIVGSISGPHHFALQNFGFQRIFGANFSEGCAEFSLFSGVLVQKQAKKVVKIGFLIFCLVLVASCCY